MNILAIDTSTQACVLGVQTHRRLWIDETMIDRSHSKVILPRIAELLRKAKIEIVDLELIVYGQGPGSFTGLRIGVGVVQGLAFALEIPVVAVSSMACLAQQAFKVFQQPHILVALLARHTEVYFGSYSVSEDIVMLNGQESVVAAPEIPKQAGDKSWAGIGSGWVLKDQLQQGAEVPVEVLSATTLIRADDLINLGARKFSAGFAISALDAKPQYLREQVAKKQPGKSQLKR